MGFHFYLVLCLYDVQLIFDNSEKHHMNKALPQATTIFSINKCIFKKFNSFYHEVDPSLGYLKSQSALKKSTEIFLYKIFCEINICWSIVTSCSLLQGEMEALEYCCDFYNKTKVALEKLQNNHRWWNRFSNIGISVKVYFQLRSTVTLISTSFWISFYSHWRIVDFSHPPCPQSAKH